VSFQIGPLLAKRGKSLQMRSKPKESAEARRQAVGKDCYLENGEKGFPAIRFKRRGEKAGRTRQDSA